jgi:hypothetical protein
MPSVTCRTRIHTGEGQADGDEIATFAAVDVDEQYNTIPFPGMNRKKQIFRSPFRKIRQYVGLSSFYQLTSSKFSDKISNKNQAGE